GWLIERQTNDAGYLLLILRAPALAEWVAAQIERLRQHEYFGVSVSIGDYDVIRPLDLPAVRSSGGGKGAGRVWARERRVDPPAVLATASRDGPGDLKFLARVHLI